MERLDLSNLSPEECERVLQVLHRDQQLRIAEERRLL